jgi:L-threonylcarbamoyladenylate synthase
LKPTDKIIKVDHRHIPDGVLRAAVDILARGGVVGYPTRCLYGLGADVFNAGAVQRVFDIKRRPDDKPLLILVPALESIAALAAAVTPPAVRLMKGIWPGRATLVFKAAASLPAALTAGTGKIGIRLPGHPAARALVAAFGGPITGTSANISGRPGCRRVSDFDPALTEQLDLVLDAGPLQGGPGSTVVDVSGETVVILREGAVRAKEIYALVG